MLRNDHAHDHCRSHRVSTRAYRRSGGLTTGLAVSVALCLGAGSATGQTRFDWPTRAVDLTSYGTVEECLAATERVRDSVTRRENEGLLRDTMPFDPQTSPLSAPTPAPITETAHRCAQRFTEAATRLTDWAMLLPLYLAAGRDEDAASLIARRLASVGPAAAAERAAVMDTAVKLYVDAFPARLAAAEKLLEEHARIGPNALLGLTSYVRLLDVAEQVRDTVRARWAVEQIIARTANLTAAERRSAGYDTVRGAVLVALRWLNRGALRDSLRLSTASYVALVRHTLATTAGVALEALPFIPIGEQAPAIQGDFWFGGADPGHPRPTPGRVALVVFLDPSGCLSRTPLYTTLADHCWSQIALIRRLTERFPALEVTIVAHTIGHFGYVPPPTPAQEADLIHEWLTAHRLSAGLVVTTSDFWRLPDPDRRRIDRPTANRVHYSFGNHWPVETGSKFIIDQNGTIVATSFGLSESDYVDIIDTLLHRAGTGT